MGAGEPVAQARIRVQSPGELLPGGYGRTDGSGRVEMDIDPGPATVKITHRKLRDASRGGPTRAGRQRAQVRAAARPGDQRDGALIRRHRSGSGYRGGQDRVLPRCRGARDEHRLRPERRLPRHRARVTPLHPHGTRIRPRGRRPPRNRSRSATPLFQGIEIVLEPEATIAGVVTGLSRSDLNQVEVYARKGPRSRDATTDTEGNFSVQGIGPGAWDVTAIKGAWERTVERTVSIERGTTEVFVELPFERGLRLSGRVVEDGAPLGGARMFVGDQETRTDQEGRFALEGLDPGPNEVIVSRAGLEWHAVPVDRSADRPGRRPHRTGAGRGHRRRRRRRRRHRPAARPGPSDGRRRRDDGHHRGWRGR